MSKWKLKNMNNKLYWIFYLLDCTLEESFASLTSSNSVVLASRSIPANRTKLRGWRWCWPFTNFRWSSRRTGSRRRRWWGRSYLSKFRAFTTARRLRTLERKRSPPLLGAERTDVNFSWYALIGRKRIRAFWRHDVFKTRTALRRRIVRAASVLRLIFVVMGWSGYARRRMMIWHIEAFLVHLEGITKSDGIGFLETGKWCRRRWLWVQSDLWEWV